MPKPNRSTRKPSGSGRRFLGQNIPNGDQPHKLLNDRQSLTRSRFFKNPMPRSGLAFAGAQTTIEAWKRDEVPRVENDGILTAEDVSTLDLQGSWLVALSACDIGSGKARAGEGVMGLRRGFIQDESSESSEKVMPINSESDRPSVCILCSNFRSATRFET